MLRRQLTLLVLLTIMGVFSGVNTLRAETEVKDELAGIQQVTDSAVAVLARAILKRDSALLGTVFNDNISLLLPGRRSLRGKTEVMKSVPLLLEKVGGWKLTTSRQTLDVVRNLEGVARETGRYELTAPAESGAGITWTGRYHANWRKHDKKWVLHNLLLSKD